MKKPILWSLVCLLIGGLFLTSGFTSAYAGMGSYKRAQKKIDRIHKKTHARHSKIFIGDAKSMDSDELVVDDDSDSSSDVGRFKHFKSQF